MGGSFGAASPWYLLLQAFWPPSLPLPISSSLPVSPPPVSPLDRPSACAVASPSDASLLPPWCLALESTRLDSWPPCLGATTAALLCSTGPSRPHLGPASPEASFAARAPATRLCQTLAALRLATTRLATGTACLLCIAVHDRPTQAIAQPCPPHPTNRLPTAC